MIDLLLFVVVIGVPSALAIWLTKEEVKGYLKAAKDHKKKYWLLPGLLLILFVMLVALLERAIT